MHSTYSQVAGRFAIPLAWFALMGAPWQNATAQQTFGNSSLSASRTGASSTGSRTSGFQQSGQIMSDAAIQRNTNSFVGGATSDFLSRSGTGTSGMGMSGLGMSGMGMSGLGMSGMGLGGLGMSSFGMNSMGMRGLGGMGGMNSFGRGGFGNTGFNNMQGRQGQSAAALRIPMRVAPSLVVPARTQVAAKFEQRISKLPGLNTAGTVKVTMEGPTAVLQGTVSSEHHRDLAARLALLEPGIDAVRNELVVNTGPPPAAGDN